MSLKSKIKTGLAHARSSRAKSVLWALAGLAGPTFLQLIYMIFAARTLGADLTGQLFLIVSVALVTSSFVGLGGGGLVMRDVSRSFDSAAVALGQAFSMSLITVPVLFPVMMLAAFIVTKGTVPLGIIALIGISDLLAARLLTTLWSYFIAREEQVRASALILSLPLLRLLAVLSVAYWPPDDRLMVFSMLYAGVSFVTLCGAMIYAFGVSGRPVMGLGGIDHRSGFSFSLTWLNQTLQTESDKILLGLFGTPALVAVYGVASRLMDGAAMPPRALRVALTSQMFREGATGPLGAYRLTVKVLPIAVIYGLLAWGGFWLLAPYLVLLFGPDFAALVVILPVLGALPLLRAVMDYGAEIFMSSDKPYIQAATQTFGTFLRLGVGALLIQSFALQGAVATALIVTATSAAVLWAIAWRLSRRV